MTVMFSRLNNAVVKNRVRADGQYTISPRAEFLELREFEVTALDGKEVDRTTVAASTAIKIKPICVVRPWQCRVHVVLNSKLSELGMVSAIQSILEPTDALPTIVLRPFKSCDLSTLMWICRIYCEVK